MRARSPRLPVPALMLVTDRHRAAQPLEHLVARAVEGGVGLVQLREKDLEPRQLLELALRVKEAIAGRALLIINDRLDVALAAEADGAQLTGASLPVPWARKVVGEEMLLGLSVHSAAEARQAEVDGADYVLLGTIFETRSHPEVRPQGLSLIRQAHAASDLFHIAIGGVNAGNARSCLRAGASGVAVISGILESPDPAQAARELRHALMGDSPPA